MAVYGYQYNLNNVVYPRHPCRYSPPSAYPYPHQGYYVHRQTNVTTPTVVHHHNPAERPEFSYVALIIMAIRSHPNQRATLKSIYQFIQDKFPFYQNKESSGWKNSIRHNLSLNTCFTKIDRSSSDQSHGHFWGLSEGWEYMFSEGNYRRRRRGYKGRESRTPSPQNVDPVEQTIDPNGVYSPLPGFLLDTPPTSPCSPSDRESDVNTPPQSETTVPKTTDCEKPAKRKFSDFSITTILNSPPEEIKRSSTTSRMIKL